MSYYTTLTNTALAKISAALAAGTQLTMSEMAVGDGNGQPTNPAPTNTSLVNEVYRSPVNQLTTNQDGYLVAEMVIPVNVGGFTAREIALFDSDGDLFAIGSMPAIVKPQLTDNALGELVLRMIVALDHAETINLTVDTALVTATQQWVEANFSPCAMFPGGTAGQVLRKASNACGDTEWANPTQVNVVVDTIEENQTLTTGQTVLTLTQVTTTGLAVYVEGVRIPRSAWVANSATQITLQNSYPAGTKVTLVQNEPASNLEPIKVGQIIMLGLSSTPAELFGYGQWQRVAEGRAIFGFASGDTDHNTLGKTGGSKTHTHTATTNTAGSHSHSGATSDGGNHNHGGSTGAHALTEAQMPSHSHQTNVPRIFPGTGGTGGGDGVSVGETITASSTTAGGGQAHSHTISNSGTHSHGISSDGTHSHTLTTAAGSSLPPYFTVAMWQRVA